MIRAFKKNQRVSWKWIGGVVQGKVKDVYFETVTRTIKGKQIKRLGSEEKPAYLVESEAGNLALKLHTELTEMPNWKVLPKLAGK